MIEFSGIVGGSGEFWLAPYIARRCIAGASVGHSAAASAASRPVTALQLLSYISAALLFQLAVGIGVAAWRWRRLGTLSMLRTIFSEALAENSPLRLVSTLSR